MKRNNLSNFYYQVYKAVLEIPLGKTRSYKWVAKKVGSPKATRAVGLALKRNPYPFIIPCHRVIKSNGSLGGYAGGKRFKKQLLLLEKQIAQKIFNTCL